MIKLQTNKKKKILLILLPIFIFGILPLFWGTFDNKTDTTYCTSCHMMKPEFYTWKASSHKQVTECITCHAPPGVLKKVKYKLFTVKEWYAAITGDYGILIQTTTPIPDKTCNQCHDMNTREVTPSGDLIIPHTRHQQLGVSCTICHTGVAHGNIAQKQITFRSDYGKWDESLGQRFMSDEQNISPDMDVCMDCHKVRKGPLKCSACHTTSMLPDNHKEEAFKIGGHGAEGAKDIMYCDSCHSYMSTVDVDITKGDESAYLQFLSQKNNKPRTMAVREYAKSNTYCKDCHSKSPPSHQQDLFEMNHGLLAEKNKDLCMTCHDNKVLGDSPVTKIACGSCHPSTHAKRPWRKTHPVPLPERPQVTTMCYTCHSERMCSSCHSTGKN